MARTLDVYLHRHRVGILIQDEDGEMVFDYSETWLNDPKAIPLSKSLPLRQARYTRRECRGFFGGILPEGNNREIVARNLGVSAKNDFALLEEIGGECAGAVTFLPSGEVLQEQNERYRSLSSAELANLLRELPRRPLLAGENDLRLSLAGAQDKIAVYIDRNGMALPQGEAPSTHILKPAIDRVKGSVFNESLCMRLAQVVGLPTAATETGNTEGIDYLLVERYDRVRVGSHSLERLHQEDFCQALGIVAENKYQSEGGPSLARCFQLIRETSSVPALDLLSFLEGVTYNFLIGNNDAHGKNFSLLYRGETEAKTRLAPFYDLLSTACYPELSAKMAMKIGSEYDSEKVYSRHFERLAEEAGLGKPMVLRRVRGLATSVIARLPEITTDHPVENEVAKLIQRRCERTLERLEK